MPNAESLLESQPLSSIVWDWEHSQSKTQWGELHGSLGQWCTNQHHYARVHWQSFFGCQASFRPHRWTSHLHRPGKHPQPIAYVLIWVQVDGIQGYDEDQIALIVLDLSNFVAQIPVILGTPMKGCIMNVIRENEIDTLMTPWVNAHVAYLLAVWWVTATLEDDKVSTRVLDSTEYDEVVTTKGSKMINTFLSRIIHAWMKTTFTAVRLNVMMHTLHAEEGSLPQGLMIQNSYTEMHNGSKSVTTVVRNSMVYPQTLKKKIPVARVVAANQVPELQV